MSSSLSRSRTIKHVSRWILTPLFITALIVALGTGSAPTVANAPEAEQPQAESWALYLPAILRNYENGPRFSRIGYCTIGLPTKWDSMIRDLKAGWYVDFDTELHPYRPAGIEYVQTIRVHQMTICWPERYRNRTISSAANYCPYTTPYTYTIDGGFPSMTNIIRANPGGLWLVGNEPDRYDWGGVNPYNPNIVSASGGQDEMLPEVYAVAYHEIYELIKSIDPTAQVANGSIIQPTPVRLEYLSKVWDAYRARYGEDMPVDVWNVHNFIFKERCDDYGADIPPGTGYTNAAPFTGSPGYGSPCYGWVPASDSSHYDLTIFENNIRAMRQWMKDHGQQNKPLIVSEYGFIYRYPPEEMEQVDVVKNFMLGTFDFFMNGKDCSLGMPSDDCRLVQRWAWYSLDDWYWSSGFNRYHVLIDRYADGGAGQITVLGQAFADFAKANLDLP